MTVDEFYKLYTGFCAAEGLSAVTKSAVGHRLPTIIPQVGVFTPEVGGKRCRSWKDIYVTDVTEVLQYLPRKQRKIDSIEDMDIDIEKVVEKTVTSVTQQEPEVAGEQEGSTEPVFGNGESIGVKGYEQLKGVAYASHVRTGEPCYNCEQLASEWKIRINDPEPFEQLFCNGCFNNAKRDLEENGFQVEFQEEAQP